MTKQQQQKTKTQQTNKLVHTNKIFQPWHRTNFQLKDQFTTSVIPTFAFEKVPRK